MYIYNLLSSLDIFINPYKWLYNWSICIAHNLINCLCTLDNFHHEMCRGFSFHSQKWDCWNVRSVHCSLSLESAKLSSWRAVTTSTLYDSVFVLSVQQLMFHNFKIFFSICYIQWHVTNMLMCISLMGMISVFLITLLFFVNYLCFSVLSFSFSEWFVRVTYSTLVVHPVDKCKHYDDIFSVIVIWLKCAYITVSLRM